MNYDGTTPSKDKVPGFGDAVYTDKHELLEGRRFRERKYYENDTRSLDVPMDALLERYSKEFATATAHMDERDKDKIRKWRMKYSVTYDTENDRRYAQYIDDSKAADEYFHAHWIDDYFREPWTMYQHSMRFFSTMAIFLGGARTGWLWKSIDRNYAKLNGVGLGSIAIDNCTLQPTVPRGCQGCTQVKT
jgi:hypothetical protein